MISSVIQIEKLASSNELPDYANFSIIARGSAMVVVEAISRYDSRGRKPAGTISMAEFLQRIAERKDVEAFKKLFEMYAPRVKSYMMRQGADSNMAEDLAQETLLTVWRKASLYSLEKGSATTWIYTIARNLRIDRLRKEMTWVELPDGHNEKASDDPLPDDALEEEQVRVRMQRALASLPADQHEVVALSYVEGLSHSEIAQRLSLPLGTVKSRMRLAYTKIREAVEDLK
jgi:RNA polymerase sigma-70 factor (ECF subfamily)